MTSTEVDVLVQRLVTPQSEGCVRIPVLLNELIDRHRILDADYDRTVLAGRYFWMLRADRAPTTLSGRYLVVVNSADTVGPSCSLIKLTTGKQGSSTDPQNDPKHLNQLEPP